MLNILLSLLTYVLWMLAAAALGYFFIYLFYVIIRRDDRSTTATYQHHEPVKPKHTFTNKEILSKGIDVMREDHRQLLLDKRSQSRRIGKTLETAEKIVRKKQQ